MKTIKFLTYTVFVLFLSISITSCKADDGADGADGAAGANGAIGETGQDGNANVQTYVYNNPSWNASGWGMEIDMAGILTDNILENDALLVYVKHTGIDIVSNIPGNVWTSVWRNYGVIFGNSVSNDPGIFTLQITSSEMNGSFTPNANLAPIDWIKVIIIESTNTTTTEGNGARGVNPQQRIYNELVAAKVDINDYYAVCEYYGINPE